MHDCIAHIGMGQDFGRDTRLLLKVGKELDSEYLLRVQQAYNYEQLLRREAESLLHSRLLLQ